jgi:hypothetical protein
MESLLILLPIAIVLVVLESWKVFKQTKVKVAEKPKINLNTPSSKKLSVLGKIKDVQFSNNFEWVLGFDSPLIVGKSTIYRYINGGRCNFYEEQGCYNLVLMAKQEEAAGKVFKVFNWNEVLSPRG